MSFPILPADGTLYTNALGTRYRYVAAKDAWIIDSQEVQGFTGAQGSTGIPGLGTTGLVGSTGVQGATGLVGLGVTGLIGVTGVAGVQGVTGSQGETGVAGLGVTGLEGVTGVIGPQGSTGSQGNTGVSGVTGIIGTTGSQGNTGSQGQTGSQGSTGLQGATGIQGQTGAQGLTGAEGYTGVSGVTGLVGVTGVQGIGGFGTPFYFWNTASDVSPYETLSRLPASNPEGTDSVTVSTTQGYTGLVFGTGYLTPAGVPGIATIQAGTWEFDIWVQTDSITAGRVSTVYCEVLKRSAAGVVSTLFTTANSSTITPATTPQLKTIIYTQTSAITIATDDRMLVRTYGVQNAAAGDTVLTYYYQGTARTSYLTSPIGKGDKGETGAQGVTGLSGVSGVTGIQGVTGLIGITGLQGVTGVLGINGVTGIQGVTGILGINGVTGIQGVTGLVGTTGSQGATGVGTAGGAGATGAQGVTGFVFAEYQNAAMGGAGVTVDWANGLKQHQPVGFTGSYYNIGFAGGATGMNGTLRISYVATQAPGITGCQWPNAVRPTLSGATGLQDIVTVYYNGTSYFAQASLAFGVA